MNLSALQELLAHCSEDVRDSALSLKDSEARTMLLVCAGKLETAASLLEPPDPSTAAADFTMPPNPLMPSDEDGDADNEIEEVEPVVARNGDGGVRFKRVSMHNSEPVYEDDDLDEQLAALADGEDV